VLRTIITGERGLTAMKEQQCYHAAAMVKTMLSGTRSIALKITNNIAAKAIIKQGQ